MILDRTRSTCFIVNLTAHELSTLLAGARMALSLMEGPLAAESGSQEARASLAGVLGDFDQALERLNDAKGC